MTVNREVSVKEMKRMEEVFCDKCGKKIVSKYEFTTGYGVLIKDDGKEEKLCYECCGEHDKKLIEDCKPGDKFILYLIYEKNGKYGSSYVSNWCGTLKFICGVREGRHNIARVRYDVWFTDHIGRDWYGVTYGDNTQICHCRLLKPKNK